MTTEISLHLKSLIVLFGVTTGLTLSLLLWLVYWGHRAANQCLSLLLTTYSLLGVVHVLQIEGLATGLHTFTFYALQMVPGPLLYFYTRLLTQPDFRWQWGHCLHLLPALGLALIWQMQLPLSTAGLLTVPCPEAVDCNLVYQSRYIHRAAAWASLIVYCAVALKLLKPHLRRIKAHYSSIEDLNLLWLKRLLWGFLLCALLAMSIDILDDIYGRLPISGGFIQSLASLFLSVSMGLFGIRQRLIHPINETVEDTSTIVHTAKSEQSGISPQTFSASKKKYQTSSLSEENAEAIWNKLQQVMEQDSPHLEPGLKVSDLASQLGVSVNHLSETINGYAKQSFYDFVNKHRIDEAMRLMADPSQQRLSVTDIGFQAGFNSNSTFFTHFKKLQNQTPRQYRKQLLDHS